MKVDFGRCDLRGANLADADLKGAKFYEAKLHRANLSGAKVTLAALREASSLAGTIMPDGSVYDPASDELEGDDNDSV
jgi:uncharacterized protein YjbI with pentapeptide repeats